MPQDFQKILMFRNRLEKVYRHVNKQARRQGITCFRIYDHDLPEFPLIIEQYESAASVSEYRRHHQLSDEEHEEWIRQSVKVISDVLSLPEEQIFLRLRKKKEDRQDQYQKVESVKKEIVVSEQGHKFIVNLTDYLDTGLFLDHRITRAMVGEQSCDKRVVNLFAYTGSFSVYAAANGAKSVTTVDLSNTYLNWGKRNFAENSLESPANTFVQADVIEWLRQQPSASADLIIMDPPTFSNSKRMSEILDVQRDHAALINNALDMLAPGGELFFSTNFTKFHLHRSSIESPHIKDVTSQTTPFDFANKLKRQCFRILKKQ